MKQRSRLSLINALSLALVGVMAACMAASVLTAPAPSVFVEERP